MLPEVMSWPIRASQETHTKVDAWAKSNRMTVTYADWHPNPKYRAFRTGSLLSHNEGYPSGLILIDSKGNPSPFKP